MICPSGVSWYMVSPIPEKDIFYDLMDSYSGDVQDIVYAACDNRSPECKQKAWETIVTNGNLDILVDTDNEDLITSILGSASYSLEFIQDPIERQTIVNFFMLVGHISGNKIENGGMTYVFMGEERKLDLFNLEADLSALVLNINAIIQSYSKFEDITIADIIFFQKYIQEIVKRIRQNVSPHNPISEMDLLSKIEKTTGIGGHKVRINKREYTPKRRTVPTSEEYDTGIKNLMHFHKQLEPTS